MEDESLQRRGALIAIAGIVAVSPDAVLIRWATRLGASPPTIIFFKQLAAFVVMLSWVSYKEGKTLLRIQRYRDGLQYFVSFMIIQSSMNIFFPLAFIMTYAANVLVLYSLQPIWTAIFGVLFLGDPLPKRTVVALVCAVCSVCVMFLPQITGEKQGDVGPNNTLGMAIALGVGVGMSSFVVVARRASQKAPDLPISFAAALGALFAGALTAIFSPLFDDSVLRGISPLVLVATTIDGICSGSVLMSLSTAARYIPGVQISLICLIEIVLGPLWVLLIYDERPPLYTLIGGILVALTVGAHEYAGLRAAAEGSTSDKSNDRPTSIAASRTAEVIPASGVTFTTDRRKSSSQKRASNDNISSSAPFLTSSPPDYKSLA